MFQRLRARVGTAVLAAGVALGLAGTANAQHNHAGGGHAVVPHVSHGFGGGHAVMPHATFGGAYRGGANYHNFATAHNYYRGGVGAINHAYYGNGAFYGGHNYYHGGYGYYRPGYRYYRSYPRTFFGLGLGLAYPWSYGSYAYAYPYSGYYSYPDTYLDSSAYYDYLPSYADTGVAVTPPAESYYPPAEPTPAPAVANAARLTVQVPADARVWIDGQLMTQTGTVRYFETPATLEPGRTYSYKIVAEWVEDGQMVTRERTVEFQAGNQAVVNMTVP